MLFVPSVISLIGCTVGGALIGTSAKLLAKHCRSRSSTHLNVSAVSNHKASRPLLLPLHRPSCQPRRYSDHCPIAAAICKALAKQKVKVPETPLEEDARLAMVLWKPALPQTPVDESADKMIGC